MATPEDKHANPWRIYGHEFDVPESKMGKGSQSSTVIGHAADKKPIYAHEHTDLMKMGRMEGLKAFQSRHPGLGISQSMKIMRKLRDTHGLSTSSPDPGFGQGRGSGAGDVAP